MANGGQERSGGQNPCLQRLTLRLSGEGFLTEQLEKQIGQAGVSGGTGAQLARQDTGWNSPSSLPVFPSPWDLLPPWFYLLPYAQHGGVGVSLPDFNACVLTHCVKVHLIQHLD